MKKLRIVSLALGIIISTTCSVFAQTGTDTTDNGNYVEYGANIYGSSLYADTTTNENVSVISVKIAVDGATPVYNENRGTTYVSTHKTVGNGTFTATVSHRVLDGDYGNFYTSYEYDRE